MFVTAKLLATMKECFAMAKLKPRMIAASGSPWRRLLLAAVMRFATVKVKAHRGKEN